MANPKWTLPEGSATTRLARESVMGRVCENLARLDGSVSWEELVTTRWADLLSAEDCAELENQVFERFRAEAGRPYFAGCEVAVEESPDRYVLRSAAQVYVDASEFPEGVVGDGDNVFEASDVTGEVLVVSEVDLVEQLINDGVPEGVVGVIDDAGGTMTAPILPDFDAVVCLAGTVRSHLAIIAREFGVPTLMGARLSRRLRTGERITVRYATPAQSVDAYLGEDMRPRAQILEEGR
ncbi:PEP-utilizing enzyme [Pseudonocardia sp. RS010]|uniref:PEP-utilizing enzyme n=1 Tax=Pseudonocardia sp. RS010 TaxID=3385979 RepID=UPI0039A02981